MKIENLLLKLLKIPSVSEKEKKIGEFLVKELERDFKIKKQKIKNNFNILAYVGKPKIILNTHLDTVPGTMKVKKTEKYLYGRGACDAKAQIAAMVSASREALKKGLNDFGLLFTVQEESDLAGVEKAVKMIPSSTKIIVVGEPTDNFLVIGQKGLLSLKVFCNGKRAHASLPEEGKNAIEILIKNIEKIKEIKFSQNSLLGKNTINATSIRGGIAPNVIPDYAEATLDIRTTTNTKNVLKKIKKRSKDIKVEVKESYDPVLNLDGKKLASKLGMKTKTVPYFTEAAYFNKKANVIILGGGKEKDAHSSTEKIEISSLRKTSKIYLKILEYFIERRGRKK